MYLWCTFGVGAVKLRENLADADKRFVGGDVPDVAVTVYYSELDVQREAREFREGKIST